MATRTSLDDIFNRQLSHMRQQQFAQRQAALQPAPTSLFDTQAAGLGRMATESPILPADIVDPGPGQPFQTATAPQRVNRFASDMNDPNPLIGGATRDTADIYGRLSASQQIAGGRPFTLDPSRRDQVGLGQQLRAAGGNVRYSPVNVPAEVLQGVGLGSRTPRAASGPVESSTVPRGVLSEDDRTAFQAQAAENVGLKAGTPMAGDPLGLGPIPTRAAIKKAAQDRLDDQRLSPEEARAARERQRKTVAERSSAAQSLAPGARAGESNVEFAQRRADIRRARELDVPYAVIREQREDRQRREEAQQAAREQAAQQAEVDHRRALEIAEAENPTKREVRVVGNKVVDVNTGQPIYEGESPSQRDIYREALERGLGDATAEQAAKIQGWIRDGYRNVADLETDPTGNTFKREKVDKAELKKQLDELLNRPSPSTPEAPQQQTVQTPPPNTAPVAVDGEGREVYFQNGSFIYADGTPYQEPPE